MLKDFHPTDVNAKPEDIAIPAGVGDLISDAIKKKDAVQPKPPQSEENDDTLKAQQAAERIEAIAGSEGTFQRIDRSLLDPTPEEWNDFSSIPDDRKVLMAESIYHNGLLQPIVVRGINEDNSRFQILAGNTRNEIFGYLYEATHDDKYLAIDAKVYLYGELTDDQAREIVSDTNYIQRASLSAHDRAFAIRTKLSMLRKRQAPFPFEKVAEEMDIQRSTVFYWDKIANLIPEFQQMFDNKELHLKSAARLGSFTQDVQGKLYDERDLLTEPVIMKISARTPSEKVMDVFHQILDDMSAPPSPHNGTFHIKSTNAGYTISIKAKHREDVIPLVVMVPKEKVDGFKNNNQKYLLDEE